MSLVAAVTRFISAGNARTRARGNQKPERPAERQRPIHIHMQMLLNPIYHVCAHASRVKRAPREWIQLSCVCVCACAMRRDAVKSVCFNLILVDLAADERRRSTDGTDGERVSV